eukprot:1118505-Amphidinium_carterae.1
MNSKNCTLLRSGLKNSNTANKQCLMTVRSRSRISTTCTMSEGSDQRYGQVSSATKSNSRK